MKNFGRKTIVSCLLFLALVLGGFTIAKANVQSPAGCNDTIANIYYWKASYLVIVSPALAAAYYYAAKQWEC